MLNFRRSLVIKFYGNYIDSYSNMMCWLKEHGFKYGRALTFYNYDRQCFEAVIYEVADE